MTAPSRSTRRRCRAKEISLTVDKDGRIHVDPYYAELELGETLVWKCADGMPWAIGFHNSRTPTDTKVIHGHGAEMDGEHLAKKQGHFTYTVAILGQSRQKLGGKPTVFLDAACPEIIID